MSISCFTIATTDLNDVSLNTLQVCGSSLSSLITTLKSGTLYLSSGTLVSRIMYVPYGNLSLTAYPLESVIPGLINDNLL